MKTFLLYLKSRLKPIAAFLLFCCVFAVVFALYSLPLGAVLYSALICALLGLGFIAADYIGFSRRHILLARAAREITVSAENLPEADAPLERDYRAVIDALNLDRTAAIDQMNRRYADLVEYYTVWAHQIKTPIAAMRLLMQTQDSENNRELIEELQRIEQYVEMVLCYLRLDGSSTDYVFRKYDIDGIIRQALRKYAPQFIRRKINLDYTPTGLRAVTDEKWLLFVVEQVLSNSLKYTRSGSISISLESPRTICIADTGIGIAAEDLPRVFDKGYTGCNGRSDKRATGIGLYLCRRILTKLGHTIAVSSEVGQGTQVRITLEEKNLCIE